MRSERAFRRAQRRGARRSAITELFLTFLCLGSVYALSASCFTLLFSVTRSFNAGIAIAIPTGAFVAAALAAASTAPWLAVAGGVAAAGVSGVAIDALAGLPFRLRAAGPIAPLVAGFAVLCIGIALAAFARPATSARPPGTVHIGATPVPVASILCVAACVLGLLALHFLWRRTRFGIAARAISSDAAAPRAVGVNVGAIVMQTAFLAGALAGLAGIAFAWIGGDARPAFSGAFVPIFAAALVGSSTSLAGALIAGYALEALQLAIGPGVPAPWHFVAAFGAALVAVTLLSGGVRLSRSPA